MNKKIPVVTVDGPVGSGKGTISQLLAKELNWHYLDSGALYRVLAYAAHKHSVALENEKALEILAGCMDVQFQMDSGNQAVCIIFEGEDVTDAIRTEKMGNDASKIAAYSGVREALLERQRAFLEKPGLVADGRDMGVAIFPDARVKFFLVASIEERANRRYKQLLGKGINVKLAALVDDIARRDARDKQRSASPLKAAEDAIIIDTTGLSIDEVMIRVRAELVRAGIIIKRK